MSDPEPAIDLLAEVPEPAAPVLVAVDVTAHDLRVMLAEPPGRPVHREHWALDELDDEEAWAWEVGGRIANAFAREGGRRSALAVVVTLPGPVHPVTGTLLRSVNGQEPWDGLRAVDALRRHVGVPVAAENRVIASMLGETWQGAAAGADDALYVSLSAVPAAAVSSGGRILRGAQYEAGNMPAVPDLDPDKPLRGDDLETVAGLIADAAAMVDPEVVILEGHERHLAPLRNLLQQVLDRVAPGPRVVEASLGDAAPLVGAIRMASSLAFEGGRRR